ncbi:MAG: nucleoside triphosphate pyrophosphohydrolase [Pseudomonadota bacterium]
MTDQIIPVNPATPLARLLAIMARLRGAGGCPWDQAQTFQSLIPFTLEEAYEVADSIEQGDFPALRDELGDLLFQVVFYARMAEEAGYFNFDQVVTAISDKLERRHPHVFAGAVYADDETREAAWQRFKAGERAMRAGGKIPSLTDGIAQSLPALVRADKLQRRAAQVGFDWPNSEGVLEKLEEELAECRTALDSGDPAKLGEEVGDLLFTCVNWARHLGIDAEQALRGANRKFERRFRFIEAGLQALGKTPELAHRDEMERLWEAAKDPDVSRHG